MWNLTVIELIELKREFEKDRLELINIRDNWPNDWPEYTNLLKTISKYDDKIKEIKTILYNIKLR